MRSKKTEGEKAKSISLPQSKAKLLTAPSSEGAIITIKMSARQPPIWRRYTLTDNNLNNNENNKLMKRAEIKLRAREKLQPKLRCARAVVLIYILIRLGCLLLTALFAYSASLVPKSPKSEVNAVPDFVYYLLFGSCFIIVCCFASVLSYLFHRWFFSDDEFRSALSLFNILSVRFQLKIIYMHFLKFSRCLSMLILYLLPFAASVLYLYHKLNKSGLDSRLFGISAVLSAVLLLLGLYYFTAAEQTTSLCDEMLADSPKMSVREIMVKSAGTTVGECFRFARLRLSFFPWYLLCLAVFPLLFVVPYYMQSLAEYKKQTLHGQGP